MRLALPHPRGMAWRKRRTRIFGRLVSYRTATSLWRPGLNRYPGEIIGVFVHLGRHCVSWVWPVKVVGLRLTNEQFDRETTALLNEERNR